MVDGGALALTDFAIAVAVALLVAAVALSGLTPHHGWGDDFAGYLLQAQSIGLGNMLGEVKLNTALLAASDGQIGPNAYPWGFPVLLWLGARLGITSLISLKLIGVVSLAIATGFAYVLARSFLARSLSLLAASLATIQPALLRSTDSLGSDIPYLALSTVTLVVMVRAHRSIEAGRAPYWECVASAVLTIVAFSVRSNGACLGPAFLLSWGYLWFSAGRMRRIVVATSAIYGTVLLILLVSYFVAFPDGSLKHASYLSWGIGSVASRARNTVSSAVKLVPFSLLYRMSVTPALITAIALIVSTALIAIGAWNKRRYSLILVTYALLNLGLLLLFPFDQGPRYLYPLLLPAAILGLAGLRVVSGARSPQLLKSWKSMPRAAIVPWGAAAVVLVMAFLGGFPEVREPKAAAVNGPYSEAMQDTVVFLVRTVPREARISFFKPRAMRLFTGRDAIKVEEPNHVMRADYFVLVKRQEDGRWEANWQLGTSFFEEDRRFQFERVYENEQFVVYKRLEARESPTRS